MSYSISAKVGNLLEIESADFIVNASNTKFILGSGVSMAFKRHCGLELQEEMNEEVILQDRVFHQGDLLLTSSGEAENFRYAIHVAVMDYNQGIQGKKQLPTVEINKKSLHNIEKYLLIYAKEESKAVTLVLPLMGCGVGGLVKESVIELYKDFFSREIDFDCSVIIYGY